MLIQNFLHTCRLVVKSNIRAALLHEIDFLLGSSGRDDLETLSLGKLNDHAEYSISVTVNKVIEGELTIPRDPPRWKRRESLPEEQLSSASKVQSVVQYLFGLGNLLPAVVRRLACNVAQRIQTGSHSRAIPGMPATPT